MNHDDQMALLRRRLVYQMSLEAALRTSNAIAPFLHLCECAQLPIQHHAPFFRRTLATVQAVIRAIKADYRVTWHNPPSPSQPVVDALHLLDQRVQALEADVAAWLRNGVDTQHEQVALGDWVAWYSTVDMSIHVSEELDPKLSDVFAPPSLSFAIPSGRVRYFFSPTDAAALDPLFEFDQWAARH